MPYELYPAVDENYNFAPEVRRALSVSPELRNTIIPMSTTERNNLLGDELWDGRLIVNTDSNRLNQYNAAEARWLVIADQSEVIVSYTEAQRDGLPADQLWEGRLILNTTSHELNWYDTSVPQWRSLSVSDHGELGGLGDNDHPQYLLKDGGTLKGYREQAIDNGTLSTLNVNFGSSGANLYRIKCSGSLSVSWSNVPPAGSGIAVPVTLVIDAAVTSVTWPAGTKFPGAAPPAIGAVTWLSAVAYDGYVVVSVSWAEVA